MNRMWSSQLTDEQQVRALIKNDNDAIATNALNDLGWMYLSGEIPGVTKRSPEAKAEAKTHFESAAAKGNHAAKAFLGVLYRGEVEGYYPANPLEAKAAVVGYFKLAANKGNSSAMAKMGWLYLRGEIEGYPAESLKAKAAAVEYFKLAANKGNSSAMAKMGWLYLRGEVEGYPAESLKAKAAAVKYFELAANKGNSSAMAKMGWLYLRGEVEGYPAESLKAKAAAAKYFKLAAEGNNVSAQMQLATMLVDGDITNWRKRLWQTGLFRVEHPAKQYFESAVISGQPKALATANNGLGVMYWRGLMVGCRKGSPQATNIAREYFFLAQTRGSSAAVENLKMVNDAAAAEKNATSSTNINWLFAVRLVVGISLVVGGGVGFAMFAMDSLEFAFSVAALVVGVMHSIYSYQKERGSCHEEVPKSLEQITVSEGSLAR